MKIIILAFCVWSCRAVMENCPCPPLDNGFLVPHLEIYEHGINISYGCETGWKPALGTRWGEITCSNGTWSHSPRCIDSTSCFTPYASHAKPAHHPTAFYPHASLLPFVCDRGYEFDGTDSALCLNATWRLPVCKRKPHTCDSPAKVFNVTVMHPNQDVFENGDMLKYVCAELYMQAALEFMTCLYGIWSPAPDCDDILTVLGETAVFPHQVSEFSDDLSDAGSPVRSATPHTVRKCRTEPRLENGHIAQLKGGMRLSAECLPFYKLEGPAEIRCVMGKWTELPVCKPPCTLDRTRFDSDHPDEYLMEGEQKTFFCSGFKQKRNVRCVNGNAIYGECRSSGRLLNQIFISS